MSAYRLTEEFLAACLRQKTSLDAAEAAEATAVFLEISRAMNLIFTYRLERVEQEAKILKLVGQGVPRVTIALRLGMARSVVFESIRRHQKARRNALKKAA